MIHPERISHLNQHKIKNRSFVLYWMQASQRTIYNHALEYAILQANELKKPVVAFFGLTDKFPEANERHYHFMLEGISEIETSLKERGIKFVLRKQSPELGAVELAKQADLVVVDRGYLKIQRAWRQHVAERIDCPLIQVESDVIVPIETTSPKEEYAAATIRPKITRKLNHYLVPVTEQVSIKSSLEINLDTLKPEPIEHLLTSLKIDRSIRKVPEFRGGTSEAMQHLENFLNEKLSHYPNLRNDPTLDYLSNLSPYLHFGHIAPLYIALKVMERTNPAEEAFLEELIVRRELSMNYVFYNDRYDSFEGLPAWAKTTLREHESDKREYIYTLEEFEQAKTHDPYWNAAQQQMVITGKMHGYMRMYWGKKILECTRTPDEAFRFALYLNNKYELDGRDPNGFTGVAWCFGKHDRAWKERPVFGKIRYMNANGLKRKFNADGYVKQVSGLIK